MKSFIRRLGCFLSWHRRVVVALLAGLGAFAMVAHLSPNDQDRVPVVVLVRSAAAGTVLKSGDLKVTRLSSDALPGQRFPDPGECVGQTLGFGLETGTVLQPGILVTSPSLAEGRSLAPVLIRDSSLKSLMSPDTPVTLVLADSGQVTTVDARVFVMPGKPEGTPLNPSGGVESLVLVDVSAAVGPEVSALGQQGKLTVILGNESQSLWKPVPIGPRDDEFQGPGNPGFMTVPVPEKTLRRRWCHPIGQNSPSNDVWGREHWLCPVRPAQSESGLR